MRFRIGTSDLTAIGKDNRVVGCRWNGYTAKCATCDTLCPVRGEKIKDD
jgi:hypothetical protein